MNIVNGKQTKLSKWLYLLLLGEYDGGIHQHKWIHFIKHILISVGRPDLLNKEVIENPKSIKNQISKTLSDLYVQEWHNKVTSSSKGKNYTLFKQDLNFENYQIKLNRKHCSSLLKFRLSNHRLPVETGRWENTPLEDRKCTLCSKHDIGYEFHYLFVCDHFISDRKKYLSLYLYKSPNIIKFEELFSSANTRKLVKLSSFVEIIMNKCSCAA